jgi:thioredoxin reductase (NADPH)
MRMEPIGIVGAGPIGLELAVAFKQLGVATLHFEAGQVGQTMSWYPRQMQFFSSPERIAIGGVPLLTVDQTKATREEYLTYLRAIVQQFDLDIRTYQRVRDVEVCGDGFTLHTETATGGQSYQVAKLILATGDLHRPRRLEVPGEDLPHVSHFFDEPHPFFRRKLMVVGGRNSAVEAALRCKRAGAEVSISYRGRAFPESSIKYWLLPDINNQIQNGQIAFYPETVPTAIEPGWVTLEDIHSGAEQRVAADFVLLLTGYEMDKRLFVKLGIALEGVNQSPRVNLETMESNVPGLYVAGTAVAGTQREFRLFIENCHPHVGRIVRAVTGQAPPFATCDPSKVVRNLPES